MTPKLWSAIKQVLSGTAKRVDVDDWSIVRQGPTVRISTKRGKARRRHRAVTIGAEGTA